MPRVAWRHRSPWDKSSLTGHYAYREAKDSIGGSVVSPALQASTGARERGLGLGLDAIGLAIAQTYVRRPGQPPMPSRAKGVGHAIAPTVQGRRPGPSWSLDPRAGGGRPRSPRGAGEEGAREKGRASDQGKRGRARKAQRRSRGRHRASIDRGNDQGKHTLQGSQAVSLGACNPNDAQGKHASGFSLGACKPGASG